MARTLQEQLDDCDAAIAKIERLGQEHGSDGGRSLKRGDLGKLYEQRQRLQTLVAREARGGIEIRGATPVDG